MKIGMERVKSYTFLVRFDFTRILFLGCLPGTIVHCKERIAHAIESGKRQERSGKDIQNKTKPIKIRLTCKGNKKFYNS